MQTERTVTISLPKNVDAFLVAYSKLLGYKCVEDFLKQEIEWHFDRESVRNRFDVYFDRHTFEQVEKHYGLVEVKTK